MDILNMERLNKGWPKVYWFGIVCLCCPMAISAQSAEQSELIRPQVASLVSSPGRCELKSANSVCEMTMSLIWEAPKVDAYCLWHQEQQQQPIECWDSAWQGSVQIDFKARKKTAYSLKVQGSDVVIAETFISVTGSYKQRKRAQRRKRGFWRMF